MIKQHLVKLAAAFGTAAVSVGLMASSAFAGSSTIFNTGNCFHFSNDNSQSFNVHVNNNNYANISQSSWNNVNTGDNMANRNIWGGSIHTGNASVNNTFFAAANANFTSISF